MEAINATLTLALDLYQSIVDSGDPRTQHFVGVHSPCPTVLITLIYLFLVFQLIPWYMKDKEPFDLRTPMFIYNAVVAGISASHFYLLGVYGWFGKYDFRCVPEDLSINPLNLMVIGHASFVGFTNSLVHAVMYAYYGLASMGPHMKKYLWWKRYLTKMQLIQLVLNIIQGCQLFILECNYPRWIVGHAVINSTIFLYLFIKFYIQEYKRNSQRNIKKKT
ncbi:Elongation of very long chain fatty acids protein [Nymphon striatum]|nr:Elongation of very long chain fatty acids protein [Nymphon striatum]